MKQSTNNADPRVPEMIGISVCEIDLEEIAIFGVTESSGGTAVVVLEEDRAEGRLVKDSDVVFGALLEDVSRRPVVVDTFEAGIVPFDMIRDWIVRVGGFSLDSKLEIPSIL